MFLKNVPVKPWVNLKSYIDFLNKKEFDMKLNGGEI